MTSMSVDENSDNDFNKWNELKKSIHNAGNLHDISEREVWWTAIGKNIGIEVNGKSRRFSRPVLIYKKLSKFGFLGIPLTTQEHDSSWYVPFDFQGKTSYAVLSQIKTMSVLRLYGAPMGRISNADFRKICRGFSSLYHYGFGDK